MTDPRLALPVLLAAVSVAGCSLLPRPAVEEEVAAFDVSRIEGVSEEEERPEPVLDWNARQAIVKRRFPGAERIELVRVAVWPEPRLGTCLSRVVPLRERPLEARYALRAFLGHTRTRSADDLSGLIEQGWTGTYRTPVGTGFEHRADFASFDVSLDVAIECLCDGTRGQEVGEPVEATVRLRWPGPGTMPEVGGSTVRDGRRGGLPVSFSPGHLFRYQMELRGPLPGERPGTCGGTVDVSLLVDPPMR